MIAFSGIKGRARRAALAGFCLLSTAAAPAADYAVTTPFYDDIGQILASLGLAFDTIPETDLATYSNIADKRAVFINCSGDIAGNLTPAAVESLRTYVANGGVIYASDWAFVVIQNVFPDYVTYFEPARVAPATEATGNIVSQGMRDYMGVSEFTVDFNLGSWVPIQGVDPKKVEVYLSGSDAATPGAESYVNGRPILVKFDYGEGSVIYTSFHNEAGLGPTAIRALEYMVLLSIMSRTAAELAAELRAQGFIPTKENIDIAQVGVPVNFTYSHNSTREEDLAFATRWRDTATIQIDASGPSAPNQNASGSTPSHILTFDAAESGTWNYSVTNAAAAGDVPVVAMAAKRIAAFDSVEYVKVYPNPYRAADHEVVVFEGLTENATVKIYGLSGQLVRTIRKSDSSGTAFWSVDNDSGEKVASGLYIYVVEGSSGSQKRGKLAVIR